MREARRSVVVDVGGSKVLAARARDVVNGSVIEAPTPGGDDSEFARFLTDIVRSVDTRPDHIVVAIPGSIDSISGVVTEVANFSFPSIPLKARLESEFGVSVNIVGDVEAGAVAEFGAGAGQRMNVEDGLYLTVSTGIGAGLVLDGLLRIHDGVGELGHARVQAGEGLRCGCGGVDCLETYSSGSGIVARASTRADRSPVLTSLLDRGPLTARDVHDAAADGDPVAAEVVRDCVDMLAFAIHGVIRTVAPALIVLGGGIALGTDLCTRLGHAIDELSRGSQLAIETPIVQAAFGRRSVLVGAALLAYSEHGGLGIRPRALVGTEWGKAVTRERS